jgi:chemotaxis protein methyltransferase CheR
MDDVEFGKLLVYLGYSWAGYRKVRKGVKKRVRRHMQRLGCRDISTYLNILQQQPGSRQECELLMTVSISRFFRDRRLWELLERRWLPDIIALNLPRLRVWSAGCACGEEAYSFRIVWERLKNRFESLPPLELAATDRHPQYLGRARSGIYTLSSLKEVEAEVRTQFFESRKGSRQFAVKAALKSNICWKLHHLLTDPPGTGFNVVFLRNNILTYCRPEDQIAVVTKILNCLAPQGLLIIGSHETLPFETGQLPPMAECPFAFKKV